MRVRAYLSVLVLVCTVGAWLTESLLVGRYSKLETQQARMQDYMLLAKDLRYLGDIAQRQLAWVGLSQGAEALDQQRLSAAHAGWLVAQITTMLDHQAGLIPEPWGSNLAADLTETTSLLAQPGQDAGEISTASQQQFALELVVSLQQISQLVEKELADIKGVLGQSRQAARRSSTVATALFLLLVVSLWLWANRQISRPLDNLANMARLAENDYAFKGISKGPREVKLLSDRLVNLTDLLLRQATHDPLTELLNRREFERQLIATLSGRRKEEQGTTSCLCYVDLDHFKVINDTCGHAAGDDVLNQVARTLTNAVRQSDVVARLGGDEFCLLLRNCRINTAHQIAEKIRLQIEQIHYRWGLKTLGISASIGLCGVPSEDASLEEVMQSVDIACSAAKKSGRNRVHIVGTSSRLVLRTRQDMAKVSRVSNALREGRVQLNLQEIVPLAENLAGGRRFEALARLVDSDDALMLPSDFLPAIERYGMSSQLDCLVLELVVKGFVNNPEALQGLESVSVNVSGQTMGDENFMVKLGDLLEQTGFPGNKLCLEITETMAVGDEKRALLFMRQVKKRGVRFALDDFGAGHASFNYLKSFPVDLIKIDGAFVRGMLTDEMDLATIHSIVEIAKVSQRQTVAEFVETAEVAAKLKTMGVDFAQGYYFSRPTPMDEVFAEMNYRPEVVASV